MPPQGAAPPAPGDRYLTPDATKRLGDRLARVEGHVRSVHRMVLEHRCADEILLQIAAVKAALNQVSCQLLDHELTACMNSCMEGSAEHRLEKITTVLTTLLRQS
jgi:CsoR family transcriptional regulator, copper-sensing transcriptional repressor